MPLSFQEYLAIAQARTIPSQVNQQPLQGMFDTLIAAIDLTEQQCITEWGEGFVSLAVTAAPEFTLPVNPIDQTTAYSFLGVKNDVTPGVVVFHVDVVYPGLAEPMREDFQVNTTDMFNMLSVRTGANNRAERGGRDLIVYPGGQLRICQEGESQPSDQFRFNYLRHVCGGPGRSNVRSDLVTSGVK